MVLVVIFLHNSRMLEEKLIEKYNRPGPRYTSYPPVPFWKGAPTEDIWLQDIRQNYDPQKGIDLYVHIPFCESLCYYCGCSRVITKNHSIEKDFIKALLKEWSLYQRSLGEKIKIGSLHFGGGTPTFLSPQNLDYLISELTQDRSESFIGSIEIDPRTCQLDHLKVLSDQNFSRVSLGIQDFDPNVQTAIHRHQSVKLVSDLVEQLRKYKFNSLNFDLIYGLPKQTVQSIEATIEAVIKLDPDLMAFYSYAHLPEKIKNQRLIKNEDLPGPHEKRQLYQAGEALLTKNHFINVGMDHFAKDGSFLANAKKEKRLKRNFMGYVDKKSPTLIGLGPSSISDSSISFVQNEKDFVTYAKDLAQDKLPIRHGHKHSSEELEIQKLIEDLMCNGQASLQGIKETINWNELSLELLDFKQDHLIDFNDDELKMTDLGMSFVRNVAMSFDPYLKKTRSNFFSQTI